MAARTEVDQGDDYCENSDDERQQSVEVRDTSTASHLYLSLPLTFLSLQVEEYYSDTSDGKLHDILLN